MIGIKTNKIWGYTKCIFQNNNFEIHRIFIKKGYRSSKHKHQFKNNMFYIENGILKIHVWKNNYKLCDITELKSDEMTIVKPREWHFFESMTNVIAYEIYYAEPINDDIIRKNCGGIID